MNRPCIINKVTVKTIIQITSDVLVRFVEISQQFSMPKEATTLKDFKTFPIEWNNKVSWDSNLLQGTRFKDQIFVRV